MDVFSKRKRSEVMGRIRGRGNRSTERKMAALLRAHHIAGWRLHPSAILGKPDIYFPKLRIAIFLDGCFWHACRKCFRMPVQNQTFWTDKIKKNIIRDRYVSRNLRKNGIKVIRLWEHDIEKGTSHVSKVLEILGHASLASVARAGSRTTQLRRPARRSRATRYGTAAVFRGQP
jgi:DNA mismatch endonuclease (patch repair protein)